MNYYKLSLVNKTLTVSKAFEEAVATGEGEEYELYTKWKREIPDLKVIRKTHKTPNKYKTKSGEVFRCNQFKNLKYENMEGFMSVLPRAEEYLAQYNFLKYCAGSVQTNAYTLVRRWFVAQFPEFRKNPIFYLNNDVPVISAMTIIQEVEAEQEERAQEMAA